MTTRNTNPELPAPALLRLLQLVSPALPIGAATIMPPLMIIEGLTPKNAGLHSTISASLSTSIDPTSCAMPCATAGLIVHFAT